MAGSASQVSETSILLAQDEEYLQGRLQNADYGTNAEEGSKREPDLQTNWRIESKLLARYSTPLFVTYVLQYSFQTTTVVVAGRLGTNELGAVSLAAMTANVTGLAIYEGLATSLDTLCSQAYGGGKKELVGLHLQRMVYLLTLVTVPIGAIWLCSPWILEALVPEKELAQLAGTYLRIYLIGMPGFATFEAGKRLMQAQGDFTGSMVVLLVCAPLNIFLNWLFVFVSGTTVALAKQVDCNAVRSCAF
jgi:multidrug resistance protein, MATE family